MQNETNIQKRSYLMQKERRSGESVFENGQRHRRRDKCSFW
jgi:hypothetical protein